MKQTELIMGMPVTIEIAGNTVSRHFIELFDYFKRIDERYSTYKETSEISQINNGLPKTKWSREMKSVLSLCEGTRKVTNGYFDITHNGKKDPSGLVKGWAINNAANMLLEKGADNFYIEAGGDIQAYGTNNDNEPWVVGIRNPFNVTEIIKSITVGSEGIATSGTYIRGQHIYNPVNPDDSLDYVKSLTVIGPNVYEADRFATAAFAMGKKGIDFIKSLPGFEAYMVTKDKLAVYTSGFERYVVNA